VHLVTIDRPGHGGSDPLPGRPIFGWASDVAELTESLGIDRFGVVGWSGGAPYAAAVAAALPDRLTGVCLASSQSLCYILDSTERDDEDRQNLDAIERFGAAEATRRYAADNEAWADSLRQAPETLFEPEEIADGDRWMLEDPTLARGLYASIQEGLRQGSIGAASDWLALVVPWGFGVGDIDPAVHLWHGAQDTVSLVDFERVAAGIRRSTLTVWPGVGHLGPAKYGPDLLRAALGQLD
jgi:pimeloyl-ACP methyl ester carboxylesterase